MNAHPNIRLRTFHVNDADEIYQLLADGRVSHTTATIPFPYNLHQAQAWLHTLLEQQSATCKRRVLAIECLDDKTLIGVVSVQDIAHRVGNVAYWVGASHWGKGVATEVLRLAVTQEWLSEFDVFIGKHLTSNPASGIVLKRNAFVLVGTEMLDWRDVGLQELQVYELKNAT
ncbi:MAG: GNAT family N-acetyltransferase [Methylotenera sp.]|nr:GNAT family N-acetyltransferase [Methylotenera sp.]NOT64641.1 GNAT family N-acetyltransferase [Methylotenera sp.]